MYYLLLITYYNILNYIYNKIFKNIIYLLFIPFQVREAGLADVHSTAPR